MARPQGDPETTVYLEGGGTLVGLYIRGLPNHRHVMLGIREDITGQPVSCAIGDLFRIDHYPVQRNPNRLPHGMGFVEDDGN